MIERLRFIHAFSRSITACTEFVYMVYVVMQNNEYVIVLKQQ